MKRTDLIDSIMPNYRRWYQPGGTYFFTVVTCGRRRFFHEPDARRLLGSAMREVATALPFETVAIVLLEDHLHCIWTLPPGDSDFSTRWRTIKGRFSHNWLEHNGSEAQLTPSQQARGHRGIWQRRFFEHLIRDEDDWERRFDYIHYNPVKHNYVHRPWDWPWSSFRRFVRIGHYARDWGRTTPSHLEDLDCE